ncbi:hypothetical protein FQN57_000585 [Myotisia sp. PD_48]|nr:hypothetical protein FQN57_000585 [Myotisia sp. PD_48]
MCSPDLFLAILAVLFPPIAVWIKIGICSADSLINIALCCLGYVPGLLHAWYIIIKHPEPDDEYQEGYRPVSGAGNHPDGEGGRVTYYFVAHEQSPAAGQTRSYGTANQQSPASASASRPPPPVPQQQHPAAGQGSSTNPDGTKAPPTYAEAVKGDNKIQT